MKICNWKNGNCVICLRKATTAIGANIKTAIKELNEDFLKVYTD